MSLARAAQNVLDVWQQKPCQQQALCFAMELLRAELALWHPAEQKPPQTMRAYQVVTLGYISDDGRWHRWYMADLTIPVIAWCDEGIVGDDEWEREE